MQSVTSNAVAESLNTLTGRVDNIDTKVTPYNKNIGIPSSSVKNVITNAFNSVGNYTSFSGYTSAAEEGYYLGFKHTATNGGCAIFMNGTYGMFFGKGSGAPTNWTWRSVYYA